MRNTIGCTGSGTTSAPPCWSDLLSRIRHSLELRSYIYTDTGSDIPTTLSDSWTNLGNIHVIRHVKRFLQPTSWMASPTLEILQTPNPTPDWKDASPVSLEPTVSITLRSNNKIPSPLVLSTPSWPQQPPPPTPKLTYRLPGPNVFLLLPKAVRIHQVHWSLMNIPIPSPPGIRILCWGSTPPSWCPNRTFTACHLDRTYPGQPKELNPRWIRLALSIWIGSSLPSSSGHQHKTGVPGSHPR